MSNLKIENSIKPKVSVLMVTYNQEPYIGKALESVLAQKHDYSIEIIVGDDASTDRTSDVVRSFVQRYPSIIRLIRHPKNIGHSRNYFCLLKACRGEYIAFLDGDDYWTDPEKLKKQIEFLDSHPDFTLSCHRFKRHYLRDDRWEDDSFAEVYAGHPDGFVMDPKRFASDWLAQTLTVVVRSSAVDMNEFRRYKHFTDTHIFFSASLKGKAYAHSFYGGVYNMIGSGLWSKLDQLQRAKFNLKVYTDLLKVYPQNDVIRKAYEGYRFAVWELKLQNIETINLFTYPQRRFLQRKIRDFNPYNPKQTAT